MKRLPQRPGGTEVREQTFGYRASLANISLFVSESRSYQCSSVSIRV
jgi:hypothetical protein